ncbi:MAG: hypothetical protein EAX96_15190 [Candidatus Lokiarchaeota archaeon]|nr:hypothetical protein [Candidatus Lokiarchaeota archaeon]
MSDEFSQEDFIDEEDMAEEQAQVVEEIEVNFWKTKAHGQTVGIKQAAQWQAASRQFSKTMEIRGIVKYKKEKENAQVIGLNQGFWDTEDPESPLNKKFGENADLNKRLVIKTFTDLKDGKGGKWTGSLELSLTESLLLTIGERDVMPVFILIIPRYKFNYKLIRAHTRKGARYMFPLISDDGNNIRFFEIEKKGASWGLDFRVEDARTEKEVALVDGKVIDIGGKWVVKIKDKELAGNRIFRQTLILFAASCKFLEDIEKNIKALYEAYKKKDYVFQPIGNEMSLFYNPRVRRT